MKMKKIMMATALAAFCGAVMADGAIESQNIVGYCTTNSGSALYPSGGMCFVTSGSSDGTFRLGDIKMAGSVWGSDWLNFINPLTSAVDSTKNVTYYSEAEAIADGLTADDAEWEDFDENPKDDITYPIGTAFLCNFLNTGITITYAGEVYTGSSTIDCSGKPYSFMANIYPGDLTVGEIKLVNSVWASDWFNFVNPATSAVDSTKNITYYSEAEAIADGGSADDAEWEDFDETCMDDVPIPMGSGFLCNFLSPNVRVVFPEVQLN
jgi:hypothetical protein